MDYLIPVAPISHIHYELHWNSEERMRIGLDIDGVVADWESNARQLLKEEFGIDLPVSKEYDSIEQSVTEEQWKWLWSKDGGLIPSFLECKPYPDIYEGVKTLREIGDVVIVTRVPRIAIQYRLDWLTHQGVFFDEFRTVNGLLRKSEITPVCDAYIDDSPEVAEDILNHTHAKMILWDRPWNHRILAANRGYYRVSDWESVIRVVKNGNHV